MISPPFEGSQVVDGTEWDLPSDSSTLGPQTQAGVYQCFLDLSALAGGDTFEFRVYEKVLTGSTMRCVWLEPAFSGAQSPPNYASRSFILMKGWTMTLKKTGGTNRNLDWSIRQVR